MDITLRTVLIIDAQLGSRIVRHLHPEFFRLLLTLLLLAVALRSALELLVPPDKPLSISVQEVRT
ncbi:hypothetical protein JKG68_25205 [Microvirga aerilata]|uniref:Uncharacterized protein n=1 Tax=Microvirga aerilata TaxID=670292 RepID=A0A936ZCD5_9HYPH|nr:hypothetical protein [Microvirga aerilata]MBL0407231.1 hypothetical protein [Microvirga aerilata]